MRDMSRTNKIVRWVWRATGLVVVGFVLLQFLRSATVHATNIVCKKSGDVVFVDCTVVNPTADAVDIVATLKMVSGYRDKYFAPTPYPPISQSLTIEPEASKSLRFDTGLTVKPQALRTQVLIEIVDVEE